LPKKIREKLERAEILAEVYFNKGIIKVIIHKLKNGRTQNKIQNPKAGELYDFVSNQ